MEMNEVCDDLEAMCEKKQEDNMGFFDRLKKKTETNETTVLIPGVGRMPYPAYRGKEPYIFVSYAHADSEKVFAEIKRFNEAGYNVWYDEGISPGNEWTDDIADALAGCTVFVVMLTPVSAPRENVLNEINFALDEKKPFIAIHLEETTLVRGLKLQIGMKQAILKYNMTDNEYEYKFIEAFNRYGLKRNKKGIAADQTGETIPMKPSQSPNGQSKPEPASQKPFQLSDEQKANIARIQNSPAREIDFEWNGSTLKKFHGIQKRVEIPTRAAAIMSEAFTGGLPIEHVTIPASVTSIQFASFDKCSNLKEVRIEGRNVKISNAETIGAFLNCPQVIVYCYKDSMTHDELKRTHQGEIRFIEESAAKETQILEPKPTDASSPLENEHKWGSYAPKGTAVIETVDGKTYSAIANSLILKVEAHGIEYNRFAPCLYEGLDNSYEKSNQGQDYKAENMIYFSDMVSVERNGDILEILDYDDEKKEISLPENSEIWFIGEQDGLMPSIIPADSITRISFNRTRTPQTSIKYCRVDMVEGSFYSPAAFLWFLIDYAKSGIPAMHFEKELTLFSGVPLPLKRIRKIVVTKNGKDSTMFSPSTAMTVAAYLKNGEEIEFDMGGRYSIYVMAAHGLLKNPGRSNLKAIEIL